MQCLPFRSDSIRELSQKAIFFLQVVESAFLIITQVLHWYNQYTVLLNPVFAGRGFGSRGLQGWLL